jgi:predicted DNA-binding transcriptional regulator AlpA
VGRASLREITIPRFAMRRDEVAASLGISPAHFDKWVQERKMPEGRKIGRVVLWDTESVRSAWQAMSEPETPDDDGENPFNSRTV